MKSMTALQARKQFGGMLDDVDKNRTHIVISRMNRPLAVLVPYEDYRQSLGETARKERLLKVSQKMDAWRAAHRGKVGKVDAVEAIRQLRDSA